MSPDSRHQRRNGGRASVNLSGVHPTTHQNHQNPPQRVATARDELVGISATWRRHWLMLQDGRDASCRPGATSPAYRSCNYSGGICRAAYCPLPTVQNQWACIMITQSNTAGDLFVVGNLLWNVRKMHFRLSHSKAIYDIAQCGR